jgi:S1-C subfamily serine protease
MLPPDTRVLPPVDPESEPDSAPTTSPPAPPRKRLTSVLFVLGALAAGVALGWLIFTNPPADPEAATTTTVAASAPEAAPTNEVVDNSEPVADVADALLPSVVQIETAAGLGSGVIYDSGGLILTAAHVVEGSETVSVRMSDGTQHTGRVLGGVVGADIAVVEVDATGLPAASLDLDGDIRVGQLAVAIGSPYGLDSTVTSGVVSAVNQSVGGRNGFQSLIQTDAAINPGNSGGALANRNGDVIGINVSIFSATGGNDGVGFAVPIDLAADLADSIVSGEPISTAVLGISGTDAESGPSGALVAEVQPGSAAESAGIQIGDVITEVDGVRVQGIGDVAAQIRTHRPGDVLDLVVRRAGAEMTISAELGSG